MNRSVLRLTLCMGFALALAGCDTLNSAGDALGVSTWFSSAKKSDLKGERISVMSLDESLKPDPNLASQRVVLPAPYINAEWPEPGGYAANAMYHLKASGPLKIVWQQDAGKGSDTSSRLTAPPIVAAGRVYVLDAEAHVFAFNARTGDPVWNQELAPKGGDSSIWNSASFGLLGENKSIDASKGFGGGIAYDNGKLFVSTGFGIVYAISASTGRPLWNVDLGVPIVNAPVASGGHVFVSSQDNHFHALNETDGKQIWDHQGISESAGILESTSAAVAGEFVIVPYTSGELFALRADSGRPAWNDMLTRSGGVTALSDLDDIAGRPVVDRDMVFAISHSGIMVAININTGERVWSRDIGGIQTPWSAGNFLYVLTTDSQLMCLSRADGRVKWIKQLARFKEGSTKDGIIWSGPVLVSDRLILVSSEGYAISISPYTGKTMGRMEIPDGTNIAPVVANGTLYILTSGAELVALR
ncbi:MAG TPA: PQQ-binding-like beta-propeller repeat protein [Rhizomicrobium sp.]|nr:PQQ-binding-like beta-propeller repeat protein [Rhizomicrobium sp.]